MKKLAIIPARGGSKRIPKKNVKPFLGIPIIKYSIDSALNSNIFDEVMVTTDNKEIAKLSISYGAKVPFYRSKKNSNDYATTAEVILEVIDSYKILGKNFDIICCLYPTAPLINSNMLVDAYNLMVAKNVDSVITVTKFGFPIWRGFKIDHDKKASYIWPENELKRSQDLEPVFHDVGQFYFLRVDKFIVQKKMVMINNSTIEIPESQVQDIDNIEDWKLAEIKYNLNNS